MGACVSAERPRFFYSRRENHYERTNETLDRFIRNLQQGMKRPRKNRETDDETKINFGKVVLEPNLLFEILSHVPDMELIRTCRLVCTHWKRVVDDDQIWIDKAYRRGHKIPDALSSRPNLPKHIYRSIAFMNPFARNLIKNSCGEDGLKGWDNALFGVKGNFTSGSTFGWTVEDPPQNVSSLDLLPELRDAYYTSCFATSYFPCAKDQRIDLYKEGMTKEIMEELQPDIYVGEWHSASVEFGATYWLLIEILDYENNAMEQFRYMYTKSPGVPLPWTKVQFVFPRHRKIRYLRFYHESAVGGFGQKNTCTFPAEAFKGQRGIKMTGAMVRLLIQNENALETKWRNSRDKIELGHAMGMQSTHGLGSSCRPGDIFSVNLAEEDSLAKLNACDWVEVVKPPLNRDVLPEVRYVSVLSRLGHQRHWVGTLYHTD